MRRYIVAGIAALGVLSAAPAVAPAAAPVASFTIGPLAYEYVITDPAPGFPPLPPYVDGVGFPFTSTSVDPDGDPLTLLWDLDGDGEFDDGTAAEVAWTYREPGEYAVSLRVTDPSGETSTTTTPLIVTLPAPPPPPPERNPLPIPPPPVVEPAPAIPAPSAAVSVSSAPTPAAARPLPRLHASAKLVGRILTVRAAKGSRVTIRVKGRKLIRRMRSTRLRIQVGRLSRGTVVGILVTQPGYQDRRIRIRA